MHKLHKFHYLVAHIFFFYCAFPSVWISMHTVCWFYVDILWTYSKWHLVTACLLFRPSGGVRHHEHGLLFYICYISTHSCIVWTPLPCLYLSCIPSTYLFSPPFPSFPLRLSALIAKRWMSGWGLGWAGHHMPSARSHEEVPSRSSLSFFFERLCEPRRIVR